MSCARRGARRYRYLRSKLSSNTSRLFCRGPKVFLLPLGQYGVGRLLECVIGDQAVPSRRSLVDVLEKARRLDCSRPRSDRQS